MTYKSPSIFSAIVIGIGFPFLGSVMFSVLAPEFIWVSLTTHTIVEVLGGFAAIIVAGVFWELAKNDEKSQYKVWIACGLLSMGLIDIFHAGVPLGNNFVWLHSLATFTGGIFFSLIRFYKRFESQKVLNNFPKVVLAGSLLICLLSIIFPDQMPSMLSNGDFSIFAKALTLLGALGF